jgi:tyrosine-protein kinase Etk/Wzc
MNARTPLNTQSPVPMAPMPPVQDDDEIDLREYWDIVVDSRWLITAITAVAIAAGGAYAVLARPVYESNLLIQVEDSAGSAKSFLGEAAGLFEVKTAAAAEMEILRSRMVIGQAVDNTRLYIEAHPRYLPIVGNWFARRANGLSDPGFLGMGGFVTGTESVSVPEFDVPEPLEGTRFVLTALGAGKYSIASSQIQPELTGTVGAPLRAQTQYGPISLTVKALAGNPGAQFILVRRSRLQTIEALQSRLNLSEKGRQSGVIDATLQSADPMQLTSILNEIAHVYVRQNVERKAAEAEKMLAFLSTQLPQFKKQLDKSEEAFTHYRNKEGTVSLDEEAKLVLKTNVDLNEKLLDAQQKRRELVARFTPEHPLVKTLDAQITALKKQIANVEAQVREMPTVQQDTYRLQRDAKVNSEVYQNLRNNELQLQLIREGKVGNVRLIDDAAMPEEPVKPKRALVLAVAAAVGLFGGLIAALARNAFFRGIRDSQEIEAHTGLSVYSTIPLSRRQTALAKATADKQPGVHLVATQAPHDPAVESLRSLRTALQFAMLEAPNNIVLLTGATPGVGKSFVSANFAAVLASGGKRVLLVDADMRKGHLNQYFGLERDHGLSEVTAGSLAAAQAIKRGVLPNLDLLTTGVLPPNPAEIMMSGSFARLIQGLAAEYDLVLLDTPPVLAAADTLGIATQVGTVLLVARAGQTQLGELTECAKRLAQAGKVVAGVLFNGIDLTRRHYGSHGYRYAGYQYRHYGYEPSA